MKALVLALLASVCAAGSAGAQPVSTDEFGLPLRSAAPPDEFGLPARYSTPRTEYFDEPNYRPPGQPPNQYNFVIGVDADRYRNNGPGPGPRPPRPPHNGPGWPNW